MTQTIRDHLIKHHREEYAREVAKLKLKGHDNIQERAPPLEGKTRGAYVHDTFDPDHREESLERLYDYLVRWAAVDDQVRSHQLHTMLAVTHDHLCQSFHAIECPEFRDMLLYLCSDIDDNDLPRRTRFVDLIMDRFSTKMTDIIEEMKVSPYSDNSSRFWTHFSLQQAAEGRISYTSDLWSNLKLTSFMAITAHYAAKDEHGNLVIRSRLIAFRAVSGSHTGVNLGAIFFGILKEYGLLHKVTVFLMP